jgi:hypothetical protein
MRFIGLAVGLLLALGAVLSWRIPAGNGAVGAVVRFEAAPPGELTVAPAGTFLTLRGSSGRGTLALRNVAGKRVSVALRARPSSRALDRLLRVRIGGHRPRSLRQLRRWTRAIVLQPGQGSHLRVRAWLPARVGQWAAGALVDVTFELRADG